MEITLSPFQKEIERIITSDAKDVYANWEVLFTARDNDVVLSDQPNDVNYVHEDEAKGIYRPLKLRNLDFVRDYERAAGDVIMMRVDIPNGLWIKVLFPLRNYLKVTLIRQAQVETTTAVDVNAQKQSQTYTCVPITNSALNGEGKNFDHFSRFDLDLSGITTLDFQLIDQSVETLKAVTVMGTWRKNTPQTALRAILSNEASKYKLDDGPVLDVIDIAPATMEEKREHYVVPETPLLELPMFFQRKCGGFYNTGIGSYVTNRTMYVYPLYDTTRYDKVQRSLIVYKVPDGRYQNVERTWRQDGDRLMVLGTTESSFSDDTETLFLNQGNGVRFSDARRYMTDELVETKDNKAVASRKKLNSEYVSVDRPQRNNVRVSGDRINANQMMELSKLAQKNGVVYTFIWENSDPSLLFPGMMCKILYLKNEEVHELHGVLLKSHAMVQLKGQGMTSSTYKNTTALFIFANSANVIA